MRPSRRILRKQSLSGRRPWRAAQPYCHGICGEIDCADGEYKVYLRPHWACVKGSTSDILGKSDWGYAPAAAVTNTTSPYVAVSQRTGFKAEAILSVDWHIPSTRSTRSRLHHKSATLSYFHQTSRKKHDQSLRTGHTGDPNVHGPRHVRLGLDLPEWHRSILLNSVLLIRWIGCQIFHKQLSDCAR